MGREADVSGGWGLTLVAVQTIGVDGCHTGHGDGINAEFVNWG